MFEINDLFVHNHKIITMTKYNLHVKITFYNDKVKCYDLFYDLNIDTPFISWCKYNGSIFNSDGLGMLVSQAAYSFFIWHNIMPDINLVIKKEFFKFKKEINLFNLFIFEIS